MSPVNLYQWIPSHRQEIIDIANR